MASRKALMTALTVAKKGFEVAIGRKVNWKQAAVSAIAYRGIRKGVYWGNKQPQTVRWHLSRMRYQGLTMMAGGRNLAGKRVSKSSQAYARRMLSRKGGTAFGHPFFGNQYVKVGSVRVRFGAGTRKRFNALRWVKR